MSQIRVSNEILQIDKNEKTFLDADVSSGGSLTANGTNFAADDYIVIGQLGVEKTEIGKISTATSTAITLSSNLTFAHTRGDVIQFIPYNQIVVERSTDGGLNYTPLTAVDIQPDKDETLIQRPSDAATDYYRVRFYNSTTDLYSDYSDASIATGFADNTVFSIKERALRSMGEEIGGKITDEFLNEALWEGRRELDQDDRVLRWSFRTKFNTDVGDIIPGAWSVTAPTDLRDPNTHKNILALRVGRLQVPLEYQDVNRFNQNYVDVAHTTLATAITGASTSLVLTSSGDFDESGSVDIAASAIDETIDEVDYTANTETTATLSGVTGIADSKAAGIDVWQNVTFGTPRFYTINNGVIYFDVPFEDDLAGENIFMDYYKKMPAYDSDGDELDEPEYDMFVSWLKWKIKYQKSNGNINPREDGDYLEFEKRKAQMINKELIAQTIHLIPD